MKDSYYITYKVAGYEGEKKAGPYCWRELNSQRQDLEFYAVHDLEIISEDQYLERKAQQQLKQLTDAVSFYFKDDGVSPGVVISSLKNNKVYASVVRYNPTWIKGKKVICNVQGTSVSEAVSALSKKFVDFTEQTKVPPNPVQLLKQSLNDN